MYKNVAGPSGPKRQCLNRKIKLAQQQLMEYLNDSDSDAYSFVDSGSESEISDEEESGERDEGLLPIKSDDNHQVKEEEEEDLDNWKVKKNLKKIRFTGNNELLENVIEDNPYGFYKMMITDSFLQQIVEETNAYAEDMFLGMNTKEKSRITNWKPLSLKEFNVFLGLWLHMGHIEVNRIQDYWKIDELYNFSCFRHHMSRNRFLLILRCLHFSKNPKIEDANFEDRLHKIRYVQNYLNTRMSEIYYPGKNLCVDESMVLWRGLPFRQYIKNKKHKFGMKLYILTEPSGLILKVRTYSGTEIDISEKCNTPLVVLALIENYLDKGHSLFMDHSYNSFSLAKELLDKNTYVTGTLSREENPIEVIEVIGAKLKKGETTIKYCAGVAIGKWRDKRDVFFISTEFDDTLIKTENKRGQIVETPKAIISYNKNMSIIDRQDQMLSYYISERKTIRWYKKLFMHYLSIMMLNSFHLYKKYSTQNKDNYYEFRHIIVKRLLSDKEIPANIKISAQPLSRDHFPEKLPKGNNGRQMRKRCKFCYENKHRKDTSYMCPACPDKPGFCLEECFQMYHSQKVCSF